MCFYVLMEVLLFLIQGGQTILMGASEEGDIGIVQLLLEHLAEINAYDEVCVQTIHAPVHKEHTYKSDDILTATLY